VTFHDAQPLHVRALLEQDRVWCAYALADLEPPLAEKTTWLVGEGALVMINYGLTPPLLFIHGDPTEADELAKGISESDYQYSLLGMHRDQLGSRLHPAREVRMWRMVLRRSALPREAPAQAERLGRPDLPALIDLFADHPDRPDSFDPVQLDGGIFFGRHLGGRLVAVAGTHAVGKQARVAAIGNVFTHPDHRGNGFASQASSAVALALLEQGIETIVLNVAMDNESALRVYRALGFWPFCGYYEGLGRITLV